jgi:uncharacterized protein YjbI with pentapeptide repeats
MKVKNLTPFLFGSKVTSRRPPQPEVTAIVRATFTLKPGAPVAVPEGPTLLAQGPMRGDVFRDDDDERLGECLYASDFADFKPLADVLLRGQCHAPGQVPTKECPVRFGVGAWSKILRVVGDRTWEDGLLGASISEARPFTRMPIDDLHAFGGPGFAANPVGRGHATRELPAVENIRELIQARGDRPAPAGFGPVSPSRPERRAKQGTQYGAAYRAKRAPYFAEDFDWSYFNAARRDQQIPYLHGDEELLFQNLHPAAEVFRSRLPGLRIRVFLRDLKGRFREVPMVLDTLFADLDAERLFLTWRGLDDVAEDDLSDLATALVVSEPLADSPLPEAHHRAVLDRFEADPLEIRDRLPPDLADAWGTLKGSPPPAAPGTPPATDAVSALLAARLGGTAPAGQESVRRAMAAATVSPRGGDGPSVQSLLDAAVRKLPEPTAPATPSTFDAPPRVGDAGPRKAFQALVKNVEGAKRSAAAQGKPITGLDPWNALLRGPELTSIGLLPPRAAGAPALDFSGQDWSDRDLRDRDFTGANLTGTILTRANLRGVKLGGATLKQAVLFDADLSGADLTGADLTAANLRGALAEGAVFRGAKLHRAFFEGAHLAGADLSGTEGEQATFSRADLTRVVARRARFSKTFFERATLPGADFSDATLDRCLFSKATLIGACFARAAPPGASFEDSDLRKAIFTDARGEGSVWTRAVLEEAVFHRAALLRAHFTEAQASRASFSGANLREARFYRATIEDADFTRANLFDAILQKARMGGAKFVNANLYDTKFPGASGAGCDFQGANLTRSTLERS